MLNANKADRSRQSRDEVGTWGDFFLSRPYWPAGEGGGCFLLAGEGRTPATMEVGQLQKRLVDLRSSLFREGILDDHFTQLQQLQDETNPDFVCEVTTLFFEDSQRLLDDLGRILEKQPVNYSIVDAHVHQLKGSSSSIGAARVRNVCMAFRSCCDQRNREECLRCLQQVIYEFSIVKEKLETLLKLEKQTLANGGSIP